MRRRTPTRLGVALVTAGSVALVPAGSFALVPVAAPAVEGHGRADGIGDPYFPLDGNRGYQVSHYDVAVQWHPHSSRLTGTTTLTVHPRHRLSRLHLDLLLPASAVRVDGRPARFSARTHELVVRPARPIPSAGSTRVVVHYAGRPGKVGFQHEHSFRTSGAAALAVDQPHVAAWWFPANDHPSDKATFAVHLTVPSRLQAISNGRLVSRRVGQRTTTWSWRSTDPMATYLAFAVIGSYDLERGTAAGVPYLYAFDRSMDRATAAHARKGLRRTGEIVRFLARHCGPYPFDAVGGLVTAQPLGFALENQTRPVYPQSAFRYGPATSLLVHELAHQWYGDSVAVRRWHDIWLNEGFATYAEWLWRAEHRGPSIEHRFSQTYDYLGARNRFWRLPIGDPGADRLFAYPVYERGAMTLHALSNRIGQHDFDRLLVRWTQANADDSGSTAELRRLAERLSGERLGGFFRAWLGTGKPSATPAHGVR